MASALDVAKYFLTLADDEAGDLISNLKLQKLLYYGQGFHLALFNDPLFPERIRAWQHGPVVREVWDAYNQHGSEAIPRPQNFNADILTGDQRDLLNEVFTVYGQFSAWKLRNMTHDESPWSSTPRDTEITHAKLIEYFSTRLA